MLSSSNRHKLFMKSDIFFPPPSPNILLHSRSKRRASRAILNGIWVENRKRVANIRLRVRPSVRGSSFGALVLSPKIVRIGHHHQLEREGEEESGDGGCVLLRASRISKRGGRGPGVQRVDYTSCIPKTPCCCVQRYQMLRLKLTRKTVGTTQVRFLLLFLLLLWTESVFCIPPVGLEDLIF